MTLRYVAELAELRQAFPRPDPQDADDAAVAEALADEVLSIPMFPHMTHQQIDTVCAALKELV